MFPISDSTSIIIYANAADALPTATTVERHGMTLPQPSVEDCYYRTLRSVIHKAGAHGSKYLTSEIGAIMGFLQGVDGYRIHGSTDQVCSGYGNAITPGLGYWILANLPIVNG